MSRNQAATVEYITDTADTYYIEGRLSAAIGQSPWKGMPLMGWRRLAWVQGYVDRMRDEVILARLPEEVGQCAENRSAPKGHHAAQPYCC